MTEHKDHFGAETAELLGKTIVAVYPEFDLNGYIQEVEVAVEGLEIKDRVMKMALGFEIAAAQRLSYSRTDIGGQLGR